MHDYGFRLNHWISRGAAQKKASAIPPRPGSAECFEMVAPTPRIQSDREKAVSNQRVSLDILIRP
jgi:hypothetical protein